MEKATFNFEKLNVYQKSLDFINEVYKITEEFPSEERYGITAQYRRAAQSIALNIAEGHGNSDAQFSRYLLISWGSVKECVVCSSIAKRQGYIDTKQDDRTRIQLQEIAKMISGLIKHNKNR
ncbi:MAG: four helix bundle protein [Bacteroidota bacterium]